jgi:hypothetical protein
VETLVVAAACCLHQVKAMPTRGVPFRLQLVQGLPQVAAELSSKPGMLEPLVLALEFDLLQEHRVQVLQDFFRFAVDLLLVAMVVQCYFLWDPGMLVLEVKSVLLLVRLLQIHRMEVMWI